MNKQSKEDKELEKVLIGIENDLADIKFELDEIDKNRINLKKFKSLEARIGKLERKIEKNKCK